MSRHNRRVPTAFFDRFTRDACAFADKYAGGKIISVLEGGYSDRALTSGTFAHLMGLTGASGPTSDWWAVNNLEKVSEPAFPIGSMRLTHFEQLEAAFKKRRGGRASGTTLAKDQEVWLHKAVTVFNEELNGIAVTPQPRPPPSTRTLRERNGTKAITSAKGAAKSKGSSSEEDTKDSPVKPPQKTLPRVVLKLGPKPEA